MNKQSNPRKPKRRWLSFNLRTFFLLVTIFAIWLGWYVNRANRQREAVKWVRSVDGTALYYFEFDESGAYRADAKPPAPAWLIDAIGIDYFTSVEEVYLENRPINEISKIANFHWLRCCDLRNTQVTDFTPLSKLTRLQRLSLSKNELSDLAPFSELKDIRKLLLAETQVSDLSPLAKLTELEVLLLSDTQVSEVSPLGKLTSLVRLHLDGTQVRDVTPLAKLPNLTELHLKETIESDISPIISLTNLRVLVLDQTDVKETEIERLKTAMPNCRIYWSPFE